MTEFKTIDQKFEKLRDSFEHEDMDAFGIKCNQENFEDQIKTISMELEKIGIDAKAKHHKNFYMTINATNKTGDWKIVVFRGIYNASVSRPQITRFGTHVMAIYPEFNGYIDHLIIHVGNCTGLVLAIQTLMHTIDSYKHPPTDHENFWKAVDQKKHQSSSPRKKNTVQWTP